MLTTSRLQLIPATIDLVRAALEGPLPLSAELNATVPATWPPQYLDSTALEFTLERLLQGVQHNGWWLHFVVSVVPNGARILIGSAGFAGPPAPDGRVEIGYGVVSEHHRQGYASEAVEALVTRAFGFPHVSKVVAQTLPELHASIGVLRKCGFTLTGESDEPGVILFERLRPR